VEQYTSRAHSDEFSEQFTSVLYEHWSDVLLIISRQSQRVAALLRVATPASVKRMNGVWRIQITIRRVVQHDKLYQPRDNEIVAQAIRLYYHQAAQFKLPKIIVDFAM
jgi:hypothetical protein